MRVAGKPFTLPPDLIQQIKFISPNLSELETIAQVLNCPITTQMDPSFCNDEQFLKTLKEIASQVIDYVDNVIITLGSYGVLIVRRDTNGLIIFDEKFKYLENKSSSGIKARYYRVKPISKIKNVSGAGDSFNSGFITAMLKGCPENVCVSVGEESAIHALRTQGAVPAKYFTIESPCWKEKAIYTDI